jgi:hypothetical protein
MKRRILIALAVFGFAFMVLGQKEQAGRKPPRLVDGHDVIRADQNALKETLVNLEKQSWEAWKNHDGKFFQRFLSDDHVEVGFTGLANKATVVAGVASPICVVKSYAVDNFQLTVLDENAALLTYHAEQATTCGGAAVPSPVWASSIYVRRGDHWLNVVYQQTQTNK